MFDGLQKKWKVSSGRLLLILITFAVGGSLTGYLGKKIMTLLGIENAVVYIPVYIILVTLIWPFMVLLISIFTGQFAFFKNYIAKLGKKVTKRRQTSVVSRKKDVPKKNYLTTRTSDSKHFNSASGRIKNIVIFASGAGSNAQRIIDHFSSSLSVNVALIVCNKPGAGILEIARREGIPVVMIEKDQFFRGDGYLPELLKVKADLLVLAGFLWKIPSVLINAYPRRIVNIHPALLPKYGGKGMYGHFVHEAVVEAGELQSGITIHYVDEHYDNGDILFQAECPVLPGDTKEQLASRIRKMEHLHYPRVVEEVLNNLSTV